MSAFIPCELPLCPLCMRDHTPLELHQCERHPWNYTSVRDSNNSNDSNDNTNSIGGVHLKPSWCFLHSLLSQLRCSWCGRSSGNLRCKSSPGSCVAIPRCKGNPDGLAAPVQRQSRSVGGVAIPGAKAVPVHASLALHLYLPSPWQYWPFQQRELHHPVLLEWARPRQQRFWCQPSRLQQGFWCPPPQ